MANQTIINTARNYLKTARNEMNIENAYIFGSCAKGNASEDSDIDIAIILKDIDDLFDVQFKLMKLRRKIDLRIEPHPILKDEFNSENLFAKEIMETGIAI